MSKQSKLQRSRNSWKRKGVERSKENCELRKELQRLKMARNRYKREAKKARREAKAALREVAMAKKALEQQRQQSLAIPNKTTVVHMALLLFCVARIGLRATSRVLRVMAPYLGLHKAPCAQTISNWTIRFAIAKMQSTGANKTLPENVAQQFIWMMDLSIGLGSGKILSVLALPLRYHAQALQAPRLQDVQCLAVSVADSWTGENIAEFLTPLIEHQGAPCAFLKDGGTDLEKAVTLLQERKTISSSKIADLSHTIANLLKHEYKEHPLYQTFMSACGRVSKNLKQSLLACLAPPKVSTKARFMNLHRLVSWADQLLQHSRPGAAAANSALAKLRAKLDLLPACKRFIARFLRDASAMLECQKVLKHKGLSVHTLHECKQFINAIPENSPIHKGFLAWSNEQLAVAAKFKLGDTGLPISTDPIESLFGVGKRLGAGQIKDAERIALRIPVFCGGTPVLEDAKKVIHVSVKQQKSVINDNHSLVKQRRDVLPHPGKLEELARLPERKNFELTPHSVEIKVAA